MTQVHVLSAYPDSEANSIAPFFRASARDGRGGAFTLAADPGTADMILFAESHPSDDPLFYRVALHPVRRRHAAKCVLYSDIDNVFPLLRGLFPCLQLADADPRRFRGAAYYGQVEENSFVAARPLGSPSLHLATFSGAGTHPVRVRLLAAVAGRPGFQLRDTTGRTSWKLSHEEKLRYQRTYAQEIVDSAFVLCPRGSGPSSYRLFEAMKAARCPVILADDWTPPAGPDWSACSLRVNEAGLASLPGVLAAAQPRAAAMGEAARSAWERYFSPAAAFQVVARECHEILLAGGSARYSWGQIARPALWRRALRGLRHQRRELPGLVARWINA